MLTLEGINKKGNIRDFETTALTTNKVADGTIFALGRNRWQVTIPATGERASFMYSLAVIEEYLTKQENE